MLSATAIWIAYLLGTAMVVLSMARIRFARMRFMDGVLIGHAYYICAPMLFILLHGSMPPDFLNTHAYYPFQDIAATAVVIGAIHLTALLHLVTRPGAPAIDRTDRRFLPFIVTIWLSSSAYGFLGSGIASGGHWYLAADAALASNPAFLLIKHVSNFARTAIFGVLVYCVAKGRISRLRAIGLGVVMAFFDLATTFNRITFVYLLIAVLLLYRRNVPMLLALATLVFTMIPTVSNMWPMFRGLVSTTDRSASAIAGAAATAFAHASEDKPLVLTLNGVFESINLVALNHIVRHAGERGLEYRPGEMFIRPVTFYLPKIVWAGRPDNFGTDLGYAINQDRHLALNSTLLGEPYINFGAYWWVGLAVLLLVYEALFRALGRRSQVVGYVGVFVGFAMWRFDPVFGIISMALLAVIIAALRVVPGRFTALPPRRRPSCVKCA
ncbi:hypothetical protein SAMN05518801_10461 [Novosphingobium sp. CF614]|uniref:hypothetical protein n=1 Tax=Novosphingobium sp. CF614 TaxID=1884364 RepID=UPI0008ED7A3E|nr:hypothetical protein [Novosphingobium sp. CF614]SFF94684.1 hypothetical protein SAMN05518801_10461 [Novosphingobium sp. CF614]